MTSTRKRDRVVMKFVTRLFLKKCIVSLLFIYLFIYLFVYLFIFADGGDGRLQNLSFFADVVNTWSQIHVISYWDIVLAI